LHREVEALTLAVGGASLFVRQWGGRDRPPVLFWHGLGDTGSQAAAFAPRLVHHYGLRVIALDAPGAGDSPPVESSAYLSDALADLTAGLLDELGLESVGFVGLSWGATVGCYLAARHPDRLDALVLLDGGYLDVADLPWADASRYGRESTDVQEAVIWAGIETPPSAVLDHLPRDLPVLVLAASEPASMRELREARIKRFRAAVPQAEVRILPGVSHNVAADLGVGLASVMGEWLRLQLSSSKESREA
jgi:alpha-beta hydrolase superfamily lysophospholipase